MPLTSYSAPTRPRRNCSCPATKKTEVLDRRDLPGGGHAWNVEDDDTKNVRQADGHWVIEQRGNTIYVQDPYPINVVFDGTDGKTKKLYRIDVVSNRIWRGSPSTGRYST